MLSTKELYRNCGRMMTDCAGWKKMALEIKSGPMLWHKRRFFGSNWRDVHSVLYNDSSLLWYRDRSLEEQEGGVVLKEAPELIAFGPYTAQVPDRPPLPDNYEQKQLMAFGVRGKDLVYWFLCPNEAEVQSWMAAIANTLPAPPAPPPQQSYPQQPASAPDGQQFQPQQMPPAEYNPPNPPPQYTPQPQQQPMPNYAQQPSPAIPGQYPARMGYRPPPYQGYNVVHPQPQPYVTPAAGTNTTVVVQDRGGYAGGGGGGDFAMGMLMGGAIGTAWGSSMHHHSGWGYGGGFSSGPQIHDTDVTINNYYDNDTSIVNNNLDMTNNVAIEQEAPAIAGDAVVMGDMVAIDDGGGIFDGGDFDGDFGGGDFGDF